MFPYLSLKGVASFFNVRRWWSIRILYCIMFLSNFTFTSMFTNLYPYLKTLDRDVSNIFYSWVVAVYPLGIFISSPFLGFWFNRCSTRQPLVFTLTLLTLLNIVYSYSILFPPRVGVWVVLILRLLMGVCSGNKAVIHAYITAATTVEERTGILSNLSSIIPLAYIVGPGIGLLFQPLGYPGLTVPLIRLPINIYTGPILSSALTSILILVSMIWFKEFLVIPRKNNLNSSAPPIESDPLISQVDEPPVTNQTPYDRFAFGTLIVATFVSHLCVATIDSLVTPYSMDEFAWTNETAVHFNNIIFVLSGIAAFISFRSVNFLVRFFKERSIYLFSLLFLGVSIFAFFPWPGESLYLMHTAVNSSTGNASQPSMIGCDYVRQPWCLSHFKLRKFQIFLAPLIFCVSFSLTYLTLVTIASKTIGPHPPGLLMGLLGSGAGLGRSLGPILFVPLYSKLGPQFAFTIMDMMVAGLILLALVTYHRLVPYGNPRRWF